MDLEELPVAVIGSGPVGLAAAAHLNEVGLASVVLEQGSAPAAGVSRWGHVPLFSPWRLNVDQAAFQLLQRRGWEAPDGDAYPTGSEFRAAYLLPLAESLEDAKTWISLGSRVTSVTRLGRDKTKDDRESLPFEVTFERGEEQDRLLAQAVIDASGSWDYPNPLGVSGTHVLGERESSDHIIYGIPDILGTDRKRYAGRRTLVVGAGHSAMHVVNDLARLASEDAETRFVWAIRGHALSLLGAPESSNGLPERSELQNRTRGLVESGVVDLMSEFEIEALRPLNDHLVVRHNRGEFEVDEIVAVTGVRPDLGPLRELRLELDSVLEAPARLAPLIDPKIHSCATVPPHGANELSHPERNFFLAGMKSYGRAPTFLMVNGYQQVDSIAAALTGERMAPAEPQAVAMGDCACGPIPEQSGACAPSLQQLERVGTSGLPSDPGCC